MFSLSWCKAGKHAHFRLPSRQLSTAQAVAVHRNTVTQQHVTGWALTRYHPFVWNHRTFLFRTCPDTKPSQLQKQCHLHLVYSWRYDAHAGSGSRQRCPARGRECGGGSTASQLLRIDLAIARLQHTLLWPI